jgi:hypothetical protein
MYHQKNDSEYFKNSKSTLRLLILFLSLALFLFVKAQQTNDFKRCNPPPASPDCKGLPNPPGTGGSACPLSIYDNEIGYGRPWSKYIWESNCLMTYILYFPYSGEPHPACKAGLITCTSQVSGNQVTFTANSTQTGGIGEIGAEATYRK